MKVIKLWPAFKYNLQTSLTAPELACTSSTRRKVQRRKFYLTESTPISQDKTNPPPNSKPISLSKKWRTSMESIRGLSYSQARLSSWVEFSILSVKSLSMEIFIQPPPNAISVERSWILIHLLIINPKPISAKYAFNKLKPVQTT